MTGEAEQCEVDQIFWVGCCLDKTLLRSETHINICIQCRSWGVWALFFFFITLPKSNCMLAESVIAADSAFYLLKWILGKWCLSHGLLSCFPWPWDEGLGRNSTAGKLSQWLAEPAAECWNVEHVQDLAPGDLSWIIWNTGRAHSFWLVLFSDVSTHAQFFSSYFFYFLSEFYQYFWFPRCIYKY